MDVFSAAIMLVPGLKMGSLIEKGGMWTIENGIINAGGRILNSVETALRDEKEATNFYQSVRNLNSSEDVPLIAENTGIPDYRIQRIKDHLFNDYHELNAGYLRFDPDR